MQTVLSNENIAAACDRAEEFLTGRKADRREVLRVRLGLEEALLAYQQHFGAEAPFTLDLGGFLSGSRIKLTVPGTMLDPFLRTAEDSDSDRFMRSALTQLGQLPVWRYSRRTNVVSFALSRQRHPDWVMLLGAVITALVLGFLLRMAPSSVSSLIQEGIVAPLLDTFLGFLNAVAGPMIFLSVVWGIYSMGDVATFSVLGKRLGAWYGVLLVAITLLTVLATTPLFSLRFGVSQGGGSFADLYRMVLDIVPSNLFTPFSRGNTLQIMFVAIIIGISMILLGEKTDRVAGLAEQLSYVVQGIMGFIGRLVPFFVFGSLFNIIAGSDLEVLSGSGKYVLFALISVLAAMLLHIVLGSLKLRISPAAIWKKSAATFLIGLTTASSSAAFSSNLKACIKNYGVAERLANFGVPFGQILYKPNVAIIFWLTAVSVAEQAGLEVSLSWLVTAALMCIILSVATPPIAGGMMASFSVLFTQLGLPMDSLAVILAINILLDFVLTSTCLLSCQVVLASAARGLGMVDETLLRK